MRRVVEALITAMPGILAAVMILSVVFYIGAVMATTLFGGTHPDQFGGLGVSALTLFQLTQFDGWGDMIADVDKVHPYAWAFFIGFNVFGAFAVLNLFVGVIVDAVQETRSSELQAAVDSVESEIDDNEEGVEQIAEAQGDAADMQKVMLDEIRALRAEVAALRGAPPPPAPAG
jgi:voltage-gated sodium channel